MPETNRYLILGLPPIKVLHGFLLIIVRIAEFALIISAFKLISISSYNLILLEVPLILTVSVSLLIFVEIVNLLDLGRFLDSSGWRGGVFIVLPVGVLASTPLILGLIVITNSLSEAALVTFGYK